ncbi:MAG TPA: leucine-rich repeat protein [Oscillospiraceae bacterium]|nr:leucine-rich repeat protein [Oscillospiraceae bacterium]
MKKFILKTVSVLLTIMLMISIIPVDCIKNGATAILDFSVKAKAADANDFSATFTNGLKYMDGNTANSFIGFIYNVRTDRVSDDMRSMGDIYRYLTGGFTKGTDEYEYAQFCFLITSEYFINKQISTQSSYASQATNNLITFLQKKVGSDESGAQQLVNSELGKVKGYIKKVLYYAFDMENDEIIQNIDMVLSSYNNVTSLVDKVKKLIESVYVTINTYYLITATNTLKAYNYYNTYLSYRDLGTEQGILELIMDVYNIGSVSFVDSVPVFLEKLGFGKSWTSADVQRILRVFAEFSFHSREEFAAYSATGNINSIHRHSSSFYREEDYAAIFMCESCGEEFYYDKCEYEIKDDYLEVISVNAVLQYCNYIKLRASTSGKINFKGVADGAFGYERKDVLKNIKTIYIPEGYTTLGKEAFIGCTNLKNIYLPSTIKFFGENALPNSIDIYYGGTVNQWMNLNLERSVTNWYNLYVNNKLVESISIDKNPKNYIFSGCSSIKEINIHDGVSKIGKASFNIYSGECKVIMPHSVVNVYYDSFGWCMLWCYYEGSEEEFYKLNVIGCKSKEENIAWFYHGISLYCNGEKSPFEVSYDSMDKGWTCYVNSDQETVTVPHKLGNITIKTYYGCSANIKNIVLCEGIENIRRIGTIDDSKESCIETITIPKSIKEINVDEIREGKVQLKKVNYCGTVEDFYSLKNIYYQWSGDIPAFDALNNVLYCNGEKCPFEVSCDSIDEGWTCYVNSDQETVTVPHRLGNITIKTYYGCSANIKNIVLCEGIENIRRIGTIDDSKESCIETITIPKSIKEINVDEIREGKVQLKKVNYCGTVEDFYSLKNIYYQWSGDIPAFDALSYVLYCNGEKCPFEVSYDSIDEGWSCYVNSDQETVTVPHKLGDIMIKTYRGSYPNVKNLFLSEGVEKIRNIVPPYHPAGREYKLNTISVPQSVNTFGEEAFEGCQEIKMTNYLGEAGNWSKISFLGKESNPTYYSKNLWVNNILLTKLFISRDVKNINSYAYINCKSLKEVSLEEGVTSIGEMAFYGSGVNKILIPRSVNFIENEAIPKDAIVYCYSDSTAYRYATENEIKYVLIDTIVSSANNKMVINNNDNYICGMQGDDFIKDVTVKEGYFVEYINQKDFLRTGATVKVYDNEEFLINVYQTVLFGDVNGDGWYDGQDAVIVDLIRNGMLTRDQIGNAAYAAADCNHNMHVDYYDVECLKKAGILLSKVNQSISRKELLKTSAEYNEYLNLIDQSVAVEEKKQETEMPDSSSSNSGLNEKILMFAEYFINLILELFSKIF